MNIFEARKILELHENFTPEDLKKNYRKMAKEYHPDKCSDADKTGMFLKVKEAYDYLNSPQPKMDTADIFASDILNNLFNTFTSFNFKQKMPPKIFKNEIIISPKEYFLGTQREIKVPGQCKCESKICLKCAGCGFNNILIMDTCMECLGNGIIKGCSCDVHQTIKVIVQPYPKLDNGQFKIKINDPKYITVNNEVYYLFDITLKESLIGFTKTFKDPFEIEHTITVKNTIIKQNDGYRLTECQVNLVLLFNIIYPGSLKKSARKILDGLDF